MRTLIVQRFRRETDRVTKANFQIFAMNEPLLLMEKRVIKSEIVRIVSVGIEKHSLNL